MLGLTRGRMGGCRGSHFDRNLRATFGPNRTEARAWQWRANAGKGTRGFAIKPNPPRCPICAYPGGMKRALSCEARTFCDDHRAAGRLRRAFGFRRWTGSLRCRALRGDWRTLRWSRRAHRRRRRAVRLRTGRGAVGLHRRTDRLVGRAHRRRVRDADCRCSRTLCRYRRTLRRYRRTLRGGCAGNRTLGRRRRTLRGERRTLRRLRRTLRCLGRTLRGQRRTLRLRRGTCGRRRLAHCHDGWARGRIVGRALGADGRTARGERRTLRVGASSAAMRGDHRALRGDGWALRRRWRTFGFRRRTLRGYGRANCDRTHR